MVKQAASLILLSLLVVVLGFASSSNIHAQELTEFSDTYWIYYEDENPNQLDVLLLWKNVCPEVVMKLNPDVDFQNITYGMKLLLPVNEPCDYHKHGEPYARLKYYENGKWLDEPYYSDESSFTDLQSVEAISKEFNVCIDDLFANNILLQDFDTYKAFTSWTSFDVFIPQDIEPCDPTTIYPYAPKNIGLPIIGAQFAPLDIVRQFNVCPEEILYIREVSSSQPNVEEYVATVSENAKPCYNEARERLIYYSELGEPLVEPYYSDLPVWIAKAGATMPELAEWLNVCLFDLQAINGFLAFPYPYEAELFVPTSRNCPENVEVREVNWSNLGSISMELNICPDKLLEVNAHLVTDEHVNHFNWHIKVPSNTPFERLWKVFAPINTQPCYWQYDNINLISDFELEDIRNVCYEEFNIPTDNSWNRWVPPVVSSSTIFIPNAAQPCYNEQGQRLYYPRNFTTDMRVRLANSTLEYSPLKVHKFAAGDNVYSISQQYNVCVRELLDLNPVLKESIEINLPVFIPDTRPCYDIITGMPLIYEDEEGMTLPTPQISKKLMYYGSQHTQRVSRYYNVCISRIFDANQAKIDGKVSYLGWIIPTDRPPCYDNQGMMIDYACYDQPVDFSVDYSKVAEPLRLNSDGTHCYPVGQPRSIVWHNNHAYLLMSYNGTMLESRAFTAWCYGVSLEDINAINDDPQVLAMLPLKTRLIPQPTRKCYLDNPELVDATHTVYVVQRGDTLNSIARKYDKFGFWIASTNQLDAQNTIWEGQVLVIPDGITMTQTAVMGGGVVCLGAFVVWRKRRAKGKRKRKNGE